MEECVTLQREHARGHMPGDRYLAADKTLYYDPRRKMELMLSRGD